MLQTVRGGESPMVTVRTRIPEEKTKSDTVRADLTVEFAGQTVLYKQVPLQRVTQGAETKISGTIPVKNEFPVQVEMRPGNRN